MSTPRRSAPRSIGTPMIEIRDICAPCHIVACRSLCRSGNGLAIAGLLSRITLELCKPREPREGNHVPDVLHARRVHQETLEAQPEAGVGHRAEFGKLEVPPVILFRQVHLPNSVEQEVAALLTLYATNGLAKTWHQPVSRES